MTDHAVAQISALPTSFLLWVAVACLAGSLAFGIAEVVFFRVARRRQMDAYQAQLAREQAAYLARLETWVRGRS